MLDINKIYNEDCLEGLKKLPDNSVDMVLTSPPYNMRTRIRNGEYTTREKSEHFSKKYGNHDKIYKSSKESSKPKLNDIYIKLARNSSTPYFLDDKKYFYSSKTGGPQKYD